MKKILCWALPLFHTMAMGLETPLIQSAGSDPDEYLSFVATHTNYITYSQHQLKVLTHNRRQLGLTRIFESAQRAFLSADIPLAKKSFEQVSQLRLKAHWSRLERRIIIYSLLRQAQLSSTPNEQEQLIKTAAHFDPRNRVDEKLFPPPLLARWKKESSTLDLVEWTPGPWIKQFDKILINGQQYKVVPGFSISVTPGPLLVSLLSNQGKPIHSLKNGTQLNFWKPILTGLILNSCDDYQPGHQKAIVYFSDNCLRPQPHTAFATKNTSPVPIQQNPIHHVAPTKDSRSLNIPNLKMTKTSKNYKPWYKKGWFWVGISVASAYAIYQQQNSKEDSKTKVVVYPTHQ